MGNDRDLTINDFVCILNLSNSTVSRALRDLFDAIQYLARRGSYNIAYIPGPKTTMLSEDGSRGILIALVGACLLVGG